MKSSGDAGDAGASAAAAGRTFDGAWFRIVAPEGFTVRPSLESNTASGYDSAFFDSPDNRVSFYICSPQWSRDATDVAIEPRTERLLSDQTMKSGGERIRHVMIAAADGSFERLVEEISSSESRAQWVFAFRYADHEAYEDYLPLYKEFKKTLEQFAD